METLRLTASRGRLDLELACVALGRDLMVALSGGTRPHIGAVALAQSRPSLEPGGGRSATASVLALLGHKEDELARELALDLAARLGATVTVACGIHLDGILPGELRDAADLARELSSALAERLLPGGEVDTGAGLDHHGT